MNKGIYIATSGAIAQEKLFDIVANNLANKNTVGFKKDDLIFSSMLPLTARNYEPSFFEDNTQEWPYVANGQQIRFADFGLNFTDFSPGRLIATESPLDIAMLGDGYFTIATPHGPRYTRSGNFTIDALGRIVNQEGLPVIGMQGEINVGVPSLASMDTRNLIINPEGRIFAESEEQDTFIELAQLYIVTFANPNQLVKEAGTFFRYEGDPMDIQFSNAQVAQGYLEESNVDMFGSMIKMIETIRGYEAYQKAIQTFDDINSYAIERLGRLG